MWDTLLLVALISVFPLTIALVVVLARRRSSVAYRLLLTRFGPLTPDRAFDRASLRRSVRETSLFALISWTVFGLVLALGLGLIRGPWTPPRFLAWLGYVLLVLSATGGSSYIILAWVGLLRLMRNNRA